MEHHGKAIFQTLFFEGSLASQVDLVPTNSHTADLFAASTLKRCVVSCGSSTDIKFLDGRPLESAGRNVTLEI